MLFGVGGNRNENQQKDRTNIIPGASIELIELTEEEHGSASLVTKSVLNILDDKSSDDDDGDDDDDDDNDDDEPIVVNQDV